MPENGIDSLRASLSALSTAFDRYVADDREKWRDIRIQLDEVREFIAATHERRKACDEKLHRSVENAAKIRELEQKGGERAWKTVTMLFGALLAVAQGYALWKLQQP